MSAKTHGLSNKHPLYVTWKSMRARCNNPNAANYSNYGGRGIKVCARWDNFLSFVEDMGEKPNPTYQVDRVDNDGNYEPNNCRWASRSEQNSNQRTLSTSGIKGVYYYPHIKRWIARADKSKGTAHIGTFKTKEEAEKAVTNY